MWTRRIDFTSALAGCDLDPAAHRSGELDAIRARRSHELDDLREAFVSHSGDGSGLLDRNAFCLVICKYCSELENLSHDDLSAVFFNIDGDNDGRVSWEDMYTYALDTAKQRLLTRPAENIRPYTFSRSVPRADNILYARYIDTLDRIVVSSRHHPLQLLHPTTLKVDYDLKPSDMALTSTQVKLVEYLPSFNVVAAYCDDMFLRLWSFADKKAFQLSSMKCSASITQLRCVQADEKLSLLYASTREGVGSSSQGVLQCIDISRLNEARLRESWGIHFPPPNKSDSVPFISDFCFQSPSTTRVVTATLNRELCITDLASKPVRTTSVGECETSIVKLEFAEAQQCIAAVHIDNQISTWVTYSSMNPRTDLVDLTKPHRGKIVGLHCPKASPQIISLDETGFVKVWDLRMFLCTQSFFLGSSDEATEDSAGPGHSSGSDLFDVEHPRVNASCFVSSMGEIVGCVTSGFVCHQYDKGADPTLADAHMIVGLGYNASANAFVTVSAHDMNIWDGEEGVLLSSYKNLTKSDISTMCVETKGRRVFLGTHDGRVEMRTFHGGSLIKQIQIHESEVTSIEYCEPRHCFLTASTDGSFCVYNEMDSSNPIARNKFSAAPLLCLAVSSLLDLIATGNARGKTVLTELGHSRQIVGECVGKGQVRALSFLYMFPAFAAAYFGGEIIIWSCRPALEVVQLHSFSIVAAQPTQPAPVRPVFEPNEKLNISTATDLSGVDLSTVSPTSIKFDADAHLLWVGDTVGRISVWQLCPILQHYDFRHSSYPATPMFTVGLPPADPFTLNPPLVSNFKAHSEEVVCLEFAEPFGLVITAGDDRRVCLWTIKGEKAGELSMGRLPEGTEDPSGPTQKRLQSKFHQREQKRSETLSQVRRAVQVVSRIENFNVKKRDVSPLLVRKGKSSVGVSCKHVIAPSPGTHNETTGSSSAKHNILSKVYRVSSSIAEGRPVGFYGASPRASLATEESCDFVRDSLDCTHVSLFRSQQTRRARMRRLPCSDLSQEERSAVEQHVETLLAWSLPPRRNTTESAEVPTNATCDYKRDALMTVRTAVRPSTHPKRDDDVPAPSDRKENEVVALRASSEDRASNQRSSRRKRREQLSSLEVVNMSITKLKDLNELHRQLRGEQLRQPQTSRGMHVARLTNSRDGLSVTTRRSFQPTPPQRPWTSRVVGPEGVALLQKLQQSTARCATASTPGHPQSARQVRRGIVPLSLGASPRPPTKPDAREERIASYATELRRCLGWNAIDMKEKLLHSVNTRNWSTNRLRSELFQNACTVALSTPEEDTL